MACPLLVVRPSRRPSQSPAAWYRNSKGAYMTRMFLGAGFLSALLVFAPSTSFAQRPVSTGEVVSDTFTIAAIDQGARIVTLQNKDGISSDVYCGPEVQRFNELKVGDKVTFRYYESLVTAISQPG